jgi:hypothetical protein
MLVAHCHDGMQVQRLLQQQLPLATIALSVLQLLVANHA